MLLPSSTTAPRVGARMALRRPRKLHRRLAAAAGDCAGESRTPRMSERAARYSAGGGAARVWRTVNDLAARPGMINMGQGFPDFKGSAIAREAASQALLGGRDDQYSHQSGSASLREEVAAFYRRRYGAELDPASEVVVTTSGQEALSATLLSLVDPGDEVIVFEPFYPFLLGAIQLAGGVPRVVRLRSPEFVIEAERVAEAIGARTRLIVHNSPHNPTGRVSTEGEMRALASLCVENNLLAISDEVYEHSVFPPLRHGRLADVPGMKSRTVTVSSARKLFSLTGWRVAWATGPSTLLAPIQFAHTHLTYCAPTPLQAGIAAALAEEDGTFGGVGDLFAGNYALLADAVREGTGASPCPAQGGYFLVADGKSAGARSDVEFCERLAEEKGVVCTPLSVFYLDQPASGGEACTLVRFTICKSREYILKACEALLQRI